MLGHRERRICAAIAKPPSYPDEYIVFGECFVARDDAGGFVIGNIYLDGYYPQLDRNPIHYEDRTAVLLGRVGPQNDLVYYVDAQCDDNPNSVTIETTSGFRYVVGYNRAYASGAYDEVFPASAANGTALRAHFSMKNSFATGYSSVHNVANDVYVFDAVDWGSQGIPHVDLLASHSMVAREKVRSSSDGSSTTYARLSSQQTGYVDRAVARKLTSSTRIVIDRVSGGATWTWSVKPYDGPLGDGQYRRDANGNLVDVTGVYLPSAEVATLDYGVMGIGGTVAVDGYRSTRIATVEDKSTWLDEPLAPIADSSPTLITRDDFGDEDDPIWSLYGGAVRINYQKQFSVNGSAWFQPKGNGLTFVSFLGDYWVRDLSGYSGNYNKGRAYPLTPP